MSWFKEHAKGTLLHLYIQPAASKSEVSGLHDGRLKIKIKAAPRDGEANEGLIEFIASLLKVSRSKVHFVRGETSRQKDLLVELSLDQVKKLTSSIT